MLPEEYLKGSNQDLMDRIGNSIIEYQGKPIWVARVTSGGVGSECGVIARAFSLPDWKQLPPLPLNTPGLDVTSMPKKLGYFNIDPKTVVSFIRLPMRAKGQGLANRNTLITFYGPNMQGVTESPIQHLNTISNGLVLYKKFTDLRSSDPHSNTYQRWSEAVGNYVNSYNWAAMMMSEGFVESYLNRYPSVGSVLTNETSHTTAVHRRFVVHRDDFGDSFLLYKANKIAKFLQGRLRYLPNKAYLSGEVERELQIPPV